MPLCHWPGSCYPDHSPGQANDWMNEIYERFVSAHGIMMVAPTYWHQSPTSLKAMIDRLVRADSGTADPTSTHGRKAGRAKRIEQRGWDYPKHLARRAYGVAMHGDVARLDGCVEPYFDSHRTLDGDTPVQKEARNVARAVMQAVRRIGAGTPVPPGRATEAAAAEVSVVRSAPVAQCSIFET